jgi:Protein of unknown function (DUF454)
MGELEAAGTSRRLFFPRELLGFPPPMSQHRPPTPIHARRIRNILLGLVFFVLGVIGVFIPVMPQIIFFFLSALFFSLVSPSLRRRLRRFRQRHPSLERAYQKWREKARRRRQKHIRRRRAREERHGPRGFAGRRR